MPRKGGGDLKMKWEYKVLKLQRKGKPWERVVFDSSQAQLLLNKEGKNGWELVNALDIKEGMGHSERILFVLKKMIE